MNLAAIQTELRALSNPDVAAHSQRFFKTGKGEYGEGDRFLGVRVPEIRILARQHKNLPLADVLRVLKSPYHEERLLALILMVNQFQRADDETKATIYHHYLENTAFVNNWDLVDSSAHQIVGGYLVDKKRTKLITLSQSKSVWERRISIIASYHFIKLGQYGDTLDIAARLIGDKEDLIHKAVGWMLREVGKRDRLTEEKFLRKHYKFMPRTMLRYAIEKFDERERKRYLNGEK